MCWVARAMVRALSSSMSKSPGSGWPVRQVSAASAAAPDTLVRAAAKAEEEEEEEEAAAPEAEPEAEEEAAAPEAEPEAEEEEEEEAAEAAGAEELLAPLGALGLGAAKRDTVRGAGGACTVTRGVTCSPRRVCTPSALARASAEHMAGLR